jgi:hypothetical protein
LTRPGRLSVCVVVLAVVAQACVQWPQEPNDRATDVATLEKLVNAGVKRPDVEAALGSSYTWYARGSPEWHSLQTAIAALPRSVTPLLEKYPAVMFYTTSHHQIWIFLDDGGVVREFRKEVQ